MGKTGYCVGVYDAIDADSLYELVEMKKKCDRLVVGLLEDDLAYRINNVKPQHSYEIRKNILENIKAVDEVISISWDNLDKRAAYDQVKYDVLFAGTEYGNEYQRDCRWAKENNIEIALPVTDGRIKGYEALKAYLDNQCKKYKIVLFGTGKFFEAYMENLGKLYPPEYAVDNNEKNWNTNKLGVKILEPKALIEEDKEKLLVIICCKDYKPIAAQLIDYSEDIDYRALCFNSERARLDEWAIMLKQEKKHIEQSHKLCLKLLVEFDRVCTKYNLKYYLNCGSVIGAVRHHGFIPWDDDVDVIMYRKDFYKLREYADKEWPKDSDIRLIEYTQLGKGAMLDFLNRLMYFGEEYETCSYDKAKGRMNEDYTKRCCLDIFLMDKASPNVKKQKRNTLYLQAIYGLAMGHRAYIDYSAYKKHGAFTGFVIHVTSGVGRILPVKFISFLHESFAGRFDATDSENYYESNGYYSHVLLKQEYFGDGVRVDVCGHQIMIPAKYDEYLETHGYHNYMCYPPANIRKPTHAVKSEDLAW